MTESNFISLNEAETLTYAYQDSTLSEGQTIAVKFTKSDLETLLGQNGAEGARFYFSLDDEDKLTLVIVAVDGDGNDMTDGYLLDRGYKCPPDCPSGSPLVK